MNLNAISTCLALALVASSCGTRSFSPDEFTTWCSDSENGLVKERSLGGVKFRMEYWPTAMIQLQNQDSSSKAYENMEYFRFHIESEDPIESDLVSEWTSTNEEYQSLTQHLAFEYDDGIQLKIGDKALPCAHYHFERNYGLRPGIDLVFAFENQDQEYEHDRKLVINDQVFGTGRLHFSFDRDHIQKAQQSQIL